MRRGLIVAYGLTSYILFVISVLWLIPFVGNVLVAKTVDIGPATPAAEAVVIDLFLILIFGVQHSGMARFAFKKRWTKIISLTIERSTYVFLSSLLLFFLLWQWRPLPLTIWHVEQAGVSVFLSSLFWAAWLLEIITWIPPHLDLFGLKQAFLAERYVAPPGRLRYSIGMSVSFP
ncbi:MAG: hypothetical protein M1132_07665 [Chloroflexi bacterium]|nr:hypothetical protein [Chloroflexota bacterium]